MLGAIEGIVQFDRPDDYVQTLKPHLEAIDQTAAQKAIKEIIKPEAMTWVIVGDLKKNRSPGACAQTGRGAGAGCGRQAGQAPIALIAQVAPAALLHAAWSVLARGKSMRRVVAGRGSGRRVVAQLGVPSHRLIQRQGTQPHGVFPSG